MFQRLSQMLTFVRRHRAAHLGLAFAVFFAVTAWLFWYLEHDHPAQKGLLDTPLDVAYWWLITCTTVGYGDISPKTQAGKVLVGFVVIVGVSMVTTLVARMGSFFLERRLEHRRGHAQMDELSQHIVVCGWHDDMDGILRTMLDVDPDLAPDSVVLLSQVDPERVNALRSRPEFKALHFVSGDISDQADLRRAGIDRARSVMVLASPGEDGSDATALLCIMAVRQLSRRVHLCAEAGEQRFVPYMLEAGCDEVIHLGSFRRSLAAQIVRSPGMGHIFHDLLEFHRGAYLAVEPVPDEMRGKTFADLQQYHADKRDGMLIGLLENVGNPYDMKRQAIRSAQMTPDISELVTQLRAVKERTPNSPVLCPESDHRIEERTWAVLIRRSAEEGGA